jgi:hypothetical protein
MIDTQSVSETLMYLNILMLLSAHEDFIENFDVIYKVTPNIILTNKFKMHSLCQVISCAVADLQAIA